MRMAAENQKVRLFQLDAGWVLFQSLPDVCAVYLIDDTYGTGKFDDAECISTCHTHARRRPLPL